MHVKTLPGRHDAARRRVGVAVEAADHAADIGIDVMVDVPDEALLFRIIRGSFQMRRKTLLNTLEAALDLPKETIERLSRQARIDPSRRGETLTLDEFARLARAAADHLA